MNPRIDMTRMPQVTDKASADRFLRWCCRAVGFGFHPDTPFGDYAEPDGTRTFNDDEAALLDAQMKAVFRFIPDPYTVGLSEFQAMRARLAVPTAGAGPVEGTTTQVKVLLCHRTDIRDPILAGLRAARLQLHVREAHTIPGLTVVHVPAVADQHLDTVVVSGDQQHVLAWIQKLAEMEAAHCRYDIELPPAARGEGDEDMWAGWFADRLDSPGVSFSVHVCDTEEQWRVGLP